jgi:Fic family protein
LQPFHRIKRGEYPRVTAAVQSPVLATLGRHSMNARQTLVINCVLDGFEGKLTNGRWAALGKCSADTALRDINDLLARGVLCKLASGGRSTAYELCVK